jgi:hypothetical protein
MATTLQSNVVIYHDEYQAGMWEELSQNANAFNGASANAIQLIGKEQLGAYSKAAFWKTISTLVARRDITSTSAATALAATQNDEISVKVHRKIGPVDVAFDALRAIGVGDREFSFQLGQHVAKAKLENMLNTALIAAEAAIEGNSAMNKDVTGETTKTITTDYLVQTLAKMGDMGDKVVAWVMHSKPYYNLVSEQITAKIVNVADKVVYGGSPATLGRPVIVTDASALTDANGSATDTYNVLGLVSGAVTVVESEQEQIVTQTVTGLENLVLRLQGEFAINVGVLGFEWDIANGGATPTDATLGTTTNWDQVATSDKHTAGVRLKCQ